MSDENSAGRILLSERMRSFLTGLWEINLVKYQACDLTNENQPIYCMYILEQYFYMNYV